MGASVSGCGDFNGGGFADVVAGAPGQDNPGGNEGNAFLWFGRSTWAAVVYTADLTFDNPTDQSGGLPGVWVE